MHAELPRRPGATPVVTPQGLEDDVPLLRLVVGNALAALALMKPLEQGGIALALSISSSVQFCLLFFFLNRKFTLPGLKGIIVPVLKSIIASVIMGVAVHYLHTRWFIIETGAFGRTGSSGNRTANP